MDNLLISNYYDWFKIERKDKKAINYFIQEIGIPNPNLREFYNFYIIRPDKSEEHIGSKRILEILGDPTLKAKIFKNGILALITKSKILFTLDMKKSITFDLKAKFSPNSIINIDITKNEIIIDLDNDETEKIVYAIEVNLCNANLPFEIVQTRFSFN